MTHTSDFYKPSSALRPGNFVIVTMIVLIVTLAAFVSPAATQETVAVYFEKQEKLGDDNEMYTIMDYFDGALQTIFDERPDLMVAKIIEPEDKDEQEQIQEQIRKGTYLDENPKTKYLIKFLIDPPSPPPSPSSSIWGINCKWYESGNDEEDEEHKCWKDRRNFDLDLNKDEKNLKRVIASLLKLISLDSSMPLRSYNDIERSEPKIVYVKCFKVHITDKNTQEAIEKATFSIPAELKNRLATEIKKYGYSIKGDNPSNVEMICFDKSITISESEYDYELEGRIEEEDEGSKVKLYIREPGDADREAKIYQILQQPVDLSGKDTRDLDLEYLSQRVAEHILKYLREKNNHNK